MILPCKLKALRQRLPSFINCITIAEKPLMGALAMRICLFTVLITFFSFSALAQGDRMSIDLDTKFKTLPKELTAPEPRENSGEVNQVPAGDIQLPLDEDERFSKEARCFRVRNMAEYLVTGDVSTDYEDMPEGRIRHRSNFRLEPSDSREFCTRGPFYEGGRVEVTIRTLVPIFSCKTTIDKEIIIVGRQKIDGGYDTRALCR